MEETEDVLQRGCRVSTCWGFQVSSHDWPGLAHWIGGWTRYLLEVPCSSMNKQSSHISC